jgi:hypothetical protein
MICYECGHRIRRDFAKFCDHCGSSLEIKPKKAFLKKEVEFNIEDEVDRATNLFLLWNSTIAATFVFYIIHVVTDGYFYLFLLVLFMLAVSWMLLLTKLHDLTLINRKSTKKLILTNFGIPIIGTFYSYVKLTQK